MPALSPPPIVPVISGYKQFSNGNRSYSVTPCSMSSAVHLTYRHLSHSSQQPYEAGTLISPICSTKVKGLRGQGTWSKPHGLHGVNQSPDDKTADALTCPPRCAASLNISLWFCWSIYMSIFHRRLQASWVTIDLSHLFNSTAHCRRQ